MLLHMHARTHMCMHTHTFSCKHTHYHVHSQACIKAGLDEQIIKKLLARSKDQDIKDKLKATTQEAFELGVSHRGTYCYHVL